MPLPATGPPSTSSTGRARPCLHAAASGRAVAFAPLRHRHIPFRAHRQVRRGEATATVARPAPYHAAAASSRDAGSLAGSAAARPLYLGLDFGTSGARAAVIDDDGRLVQDVRCGYGEGAGADWAAAWRRVMFQLIGDLDPDLRSQLASLALDGTSATALLVDPRDGAPLAPPKLYDEAQGRAAVEAAKALAPPAHTATAPTCTLCKLLTWWLEAEGEAEGKEPKQGWRQLAASRGLSTPGPASLPSSAPAAASSLGPALSSPNGSSSPPPSPLLLHQADWLAALLHGQFSAGGVTDWNNALKLGYDPGAERYPDWLASQPFAPLLPARVVAPGAPVGRIDPRVAAANGLPPGCLVCGGTTDSIAAFVAAGVTEPGQAVTSLGSTLAVKLLSMTRVDDAAYGIYSHRLGDVWLVGGASNTGGAVLRRFFSDSELRNLTSALDPDRPTGLDYYPLPRPGERFPLADPGLQPRMDPRPEDDTLFLQGLLEGMARIEATAYRRLAELGASPLTEVLTAGGGAANPKWTLIRQRMLGVPVRAAEQGEACYGAALLARQGAREAAAAAAAATARSH